MKLKESNKRLAIMVLIFLFVICSSFVIYTNIYAEDNEPSPLFEESLKKTVEEFESETKKIVQNSILEQYWNLIPKQYKIKTQNNGYLPLRSFRRIFPSPIRRRTNSRTIPSPIRRRTNRRTSPPQLIKNPTVTLHPARRLITPLPLLFPLESPRLWDVPAASPVEHALHVQAGGVSILPRGVRIVPLWSAQTARTDWPKTTKSPIL